MNTEKRYETPRTVGELRKVLADFPDETPIQFASTDAPEYGWLEIGGDWDRGYLNGEVHASNPN